MFSFVPKRSAISMLRNPSATRALKRRSLSLRSSSGNLDKEHVPCKYSRWRLPQALHHVRSECNVLASLRTDRNRIIDNELWRFAAAERVAGTLDNLSDWIVECDFILPCRNKLSGI